MSLYPFFDPKHLSYMGEYMRDYMPVATNYDPPTSSLNADIVNTDEKFSVNLNVSQFKPDELKINLDGRKLSIQGEQDVVTDHGRSAKSFSRVIVLPEDVDVASVASSLSDDGKLSIEAPKLIPVPGRSIPIRKMPAIDQQKY
ncbi:hypothetical protein L5515_008952 [Caenorhabditis briggsae]|uniref:SHSP domain-containing protein n=2 Tax=Caenorhabditis briggsae TaxID=6238 RepID=A0AAE9F2C2_CAEBR|nr:hypothetical protein L5515_008952 [Caenorhabditis briggsae]